MHSSKMPIARPDDPITSKIFTMGWAVKHPKRKQVINVIEMHSNIALRVTT